MNNKIFLVCMLLTLTTTQILAKDYYGVRYSEKAIDITHLDPIYSDDSHRWLRFAELINARLVTNNEKLQQYEDLLIKMPTNDDETKFSLSLKDVLNWKDGTPITTSDIEFTFNLYKTSNRNEYLKVVDLVNVEIINDKEFVFTKPENVGMTEFRNAVNFYLPNIYILPKHIVKKIPLEEFGEFTEKPLGAGPYYINQINKDGEKITISLLKNDYYHKSPVARGIKEVEVVTENEIGNAVKNLQKDTENCIKNGKNTCIDIIAENLDSKKLKDDLDQEKFINKYPYAENSWMGIAFNTSLPLLDISEFRIIIDQIIDDEILIKRYYNKMGTDINAIDITGPFHPDFGIYAKGLYDRKEKPSTVIENLINGGFRIKDDGSDWLQVFNSKNGDYEDLELVLLYDKNEVADGSITRQVLTAIQRQFNKCKINLILDGQDAKNFDIKIKEKINWDLAFKKYVFDWQTNVKPLFEKDHNFNITSYHTPALDKLLEEYKTYKTIDKIKKGEQIHEHCWNNLPYLFLWSVKAKTYYRDIIKDVKITPMTFFGTINDWMISPRTEENE